MSGPDVVLTAVKFFFSTMAFIFILLFFFHLRLDQYFLHLWNKYIVHGNRYAVAAVYISFLLILALVIINASYGLFTLLIFIWLLRYRRMKDYERTEELGKKELEKVLEKIKKV